MCWAEGGQNVHYMFYYQYEELNMYFVSCLNVMSIKNSHDI